MARGTRERFLIHFGKLRKQVIVSMWYGHFDSLWNRNLIVFKKLLWPILLFQRSFWSSQEQDPFLQHLIPVNIKVDHNPNVEKSERIFWRINSQTFLIHWVISTCLLMDLNIFYPFSSEAFFEPLTEVEQKAWLLSKKCCLLMDQI